MEKLQKLQKYQDLAKTLIGAFGKLQNMLPNEMQNKCSVFSEQKSSLENKLAESYEKLEELKKVTDKTDMELEHNMEGENDEEKKVEPLPDQSPYQLIDQKTDKLLRDMARLNINCSDPEVRKACGE